MDIMLTQRRRRLILRRRRFVVVALAAAAVVLMQRRIGHSSIKEQQDRLRNILLDRLYNGSDINCYNQLRMSKSAFHNLCHILVEKGLLVETQNVCVNESVGLFLYILAHNNKFRDVGGTYLRSIDTISRHFNNVLRAILKMSGDYIKLPETSESHKWGHFKNCVGAIDGTHIEVTVPVADQGRYRNRKQCITTNVLGVCDAHMRFIYVLPGWEGSSSDSRVLRNALEREDRFEVPLGKYYLVDAGYTNGPGYLAPYRSTRYHLQEWATQGNNPTTYKELFNLRHSKKRNVIERTFGLLKKRWAILRQPSFFDIKRQVQIINVCCILHNFLMDKKLLNDARLLEEVDEDILTHPTIGDSYEYEDTHEPIHATTEWTVFRDTLAAGITALWEECRVHMTKEKIMARLKTWNKYFQEISAMLDTSGFGWDWEKHVVKVDSEEVWADYIKAHPSLKHYKDKVIINWGDLATLCGTDRANGANASTGVEAANDVHVVDIEDDDVGDAPTRNRKKKKTKRTSPIDLIAAAVTHIAQNMDGPVDATPTMQPSGDQARLEKMYAALSIMPELSESDLIKAIDILLADEIKCRMFLIMPEILRRAWLRVQLDN